MGPVLPTPCPRASPGAAHAARPPTGRRIVHVSDLHFGSPGVAERVGPLLSALAALEPTIVAVSGDITRRAAPSEFRQARDFLDRLGVPFVVVPGNHDVPLAPWIRFRRRHARFLAHVVDHLDPFFTDGDVAVAGIDTSRSFAIDGGRARRRTLASLGERFRDVPADAFRVVVAHHPFTRPPSQRMAVVAQKSQRALQAFHALHVDAVLTGHRHESVVARCSRGAEGAERHTLFVQAGTATTYRGRRTEKDMNSFLVLDVDRSHVWCTRHVLHDDGDFREDRTESHPRAARRAS